MENWDLNNMVLHQLELKKRRTAYTVFILEMDFFLIFGKLLAYYYAESG